jgi:hypothetical protein
MLLLMMLLMLDCLLMFPLLLPGHLVSPRVGVHLVRVPPI